ncbi:unnamed protein product [Brachionus calyciflorus]|uniref:DUF4218 domain-containing protein n=1 Tax=Brachionus calyciflorus TaxID=104777 RepID=A0A814D8D0_9BILA|nr:unnamed protein product [Brachionus calyciflorus]
MIDDNSSDSDIYFDDKKIAKPNLTNYEKKIHQKELIRREKNKIYNRNYRQKKKLKSETDDLIDIEEPFVNLDDLNESLNDYESDYDEKLSNTSDFEFYGNCENEENSESENEHSENYFSEDESETESDDEDFELDEEIYPGSEIKSNDFVFSFLLCCREMKVSNKSMTILLKFIKSILPRENKIPTSYYSIIKKTKIPPKNEFSVCNICHKISDKPLCESDLCKNIGKKLKKNFEKPAKIFQLDFLKHLRNVVIENQLVIENYKRELNDYKISDVSNMPFYGNEKNYISLILFVDEVSFSKSTNNNRIYLKNLSLYLNKENLLKINSKDYNIRIYCLIADAPARAKVLNIIQFNGEFGCFHCLHPGKNIGQGRGGNKRVYCAKVFPLRKNSLYLEQVKEVKQKKEMLYGIKSSSYLSKWIMLPDSCLLDYMHLCLEGGVKKLINLWFNSTYSSNDFYLGIKMKEINNYLRLIKFPNEFSRSQRSLEFRNLYKAIEFKNFIFYTSIGLIDFLPEKYFNNALKYIIFLRLLCQEKLNEDDFILSQKLIENFIFEYEELYGVQHMTYNLHAHIHLPIQAFKFGPINKVSSFAFEGMFKIFRDLFHGTNGFVGQIVKKLQLETDFFFNQNLNFKFDHKNGLIYEKIKEFYCEIEETDNFTLISLEQIISKCILIKTKKSVITTEVVGKFEHD